METGDRLYRERAGALSSLCAGAGALCAGAAAHGDAMSASREPDRWRRGERAQPCQDEGPSQRSTRLGIGHPSDAAITAEALRRDSLCISCKNIYRYLRINGFFHVCIYYRGANAVLTGRHDQHRDVGGGGNVLSIAAGGSARAAWKTKGMVADGVMAIACFGDTLSALPGDPSRRSNLHANKRSECFCAHGGRRQSTGGSHRSRPTHTSLHAS